MASNQAEGVRVSDATACHIILKQGRSNQYLQLLDLGGQGLEAGLVLLDGAPALAHPLERSLWVLIGVALALVETCNT